MLPLYPTDLQAALNPKEAAEDCSGWRKDDECFLHKVLYPFTNFCGDMRLLKSTMRFAESQYRAASNNKAGS